MLGIGARIEVALLASLVLAVLAVLAAITVTPFAWWLFAGDLLVFVAFAFVLALRERRLRAATERVLGRSLGINEPLVTAWLRWARSVREQLRSANRELQDIGLVLENMGEGIVVLNEHQHIRRINAAAERLLGLNRQVVFGRHFRDVLPQQDLVRFISSILIEGSQTEADIKLSEGDSRYLQASGQLLLSDNPKAPGGIVIVLNEVTRLRRLERARRDFVANVSHELKTPITSIQGFVETLLDGAIENREDTMKFLEIIRRQSERLGQIFNDMLTLSKIEAEQDLEAEPADLLSIARSVVASLEWRARERNVSLSLVGVPVPVLINGQLIEQALANLVDNAIKYGAAQHHGRVVVSVTRRDESGVVAVEDNGPGIEPRHLPRIFERFYRVDKGRSRNEGGTGLGLAIVKHIAQAHGGQASVASEPGVRTVFEISVPLIPAS